jgi:hypothetical protein
MASEPRTFQFTVSKEQIAVATSELFHFIGHVMTRWAQLETSLYYWFGRITAMPEGMSRAIFYGARGFAARAEMLEAAIEYATTLTPAEADFLKEALKKARQYSSFRNKIAHGEPRLNVIQLENTEIHYTITQGKNKPTGDDEAITLDHLTTAANNIHLLTDCIRDMLQVKLATLKANPRSPEECLSLVRALPNQADSKSDPTAEASGQPPQEPGRANKKAYRAEQAAKKNSAEDD